MSVASPADPRDVQDFQFKLHCRLKIFSGHESFTNAVNLVATSSKYGLIFVGCPNGIQVITTPSINGLDHPGGSGVEINNYPRREVPLPSKPTHLSISCDHNYLLVAVTKDGCAHGLVYSIPSFTAKNISLVSEIRLSSKADTSVLELTWNPGIPNVLAACLSDGSMAAFELKPTGLDISTLPPATQATCFCWSPKGKQLVVGTENGTLTQYKPDLKPVKTLSAPALGSGSVALVNVLWISNYQFAAIYRDKANPEERPGLLIVNAPKTGALSFINYEDICYSGGELRNPQFYLIHQPAWNILIVASANSMEVGVLGLQEDQISWEQWNQEDAARAELPLTSDKQETFPVGMSLDTSSQRELPWGENQTLPPMPILLLLSHQGVLCLFHAINLKPEAPHLCSPPERLPDESGLVLFSTTPSLPAEKQQEIRYPPQQPPSQMQSGRTLTSGDGSFNISIAPKFDTTTPSLVGSTAPAPSLFGQATSAPSIPFGAGMPAPSLSFGSGLGSTTQPSIFGTGLGAATITPTTTTSFTGGLTSTTSSFGTGLLGSSSTGFAVASTTGFGTGLVSQPATSVTTPALSTFGSSSSAPAISFGLGGQPPSLGSSLNIPSVGFGSGPGLGFSSNTAPTSKPAFSFQTSTSTPTAGISVKPPAAPNTDNVTFSAPHATSTPQPTLKLSSQQTSLPSQQVPATAKPSVSFFGSATPSLQISEQPQISKIQPPTQPTKAEVPTLETKQSQLKQSNTLAPAVTSAKPVDIPAVSTVFFNAINVEMAHFERELADLRTRVNNINVQVGSEEEKQLLCHKVALMAEFWRELKETTQAQSSEIHSLKSELMEAFAWTEEAKSRAQQLNSPMYLQLTRSQTLDPVTARHANNIKHMVYYVENQMRQINEQLDSNWIDFQDACKPNVKNKMRVPTLETVYQAMVMHNNILNKQRVIMADIARRAQEQGRNTQVPLISSAVLARVRSKEASQLTKGETELSRLAENLVQLKLGPPVTHIVNTRRLSRKKESNLREILSQSTVTRICPTKPSRSTLGGISTGKPVITKLDAAVNRDGSRLLSGTVITEPKPPPVVAKPETSQTSLFLFGSNKASGVVDTVNKSAGNLDFSIGSVKAPENEVSAPSSIVPHAEVSKAKPNISDVTSLPKLGTFTGGLQSNTASSTQFVFGTPLQSGKTSVPENFSFGASLTKVPSVGKLSDATKRLESYYEDVTPPSTPERSHKEPTPSPVASPSTTFTFSFTPSTKPSIVPPSPGSGASPIQKSPLMSLDSIVAGIGDGNITIKPVNKPSDTKPLSLSLGSTGGGGGAFSFGSLSLGQPQQTVKAEEPKKPAETFKFALPTSTFSTVTTTSATVGSSGDAVQVTAIKAAAVTTTTVTTTTTGTNLKTPLFTSFGSENRQPSTTQSSIFGGSDGQKPTLSFATSGSGSTAASATNIFAQTGPSIFGGLTTGSPAKQSGSIFGVSPSSSISSHVFGKQSTESATTSSATITAEAQPKKTESPKKDETPAVTSSSDNTFVQSASLFGGLSMGTPVSSSKPISNIFGGTTTFSFAKPPVSTETQASPAETKSETLSQTSESQPTETKLASLNIFGQPSSVTVDKPESSETTQSQSVSSTTSIFGGVKVDNTAAVNFSFATPAATTISTSTPQTSLIFGQASTAAKPGTGSIFGAVVTTAVTTQQSLPLASATITTTATAQTTSETSSTFTFSLPASTQASSPFAQKSLFGQTTATTTTSSSSSFFGQPICSPSGFGQSGGSIFGQPAATTAKTNIFGQTPATTTTPPVFGQAAANTSQSVFGQSSTTQPFGQAPATGSSFLGGNTGGFGSKPAFGQSGGSIFGQSGSSGFGSSGGSIFGGSGTPVFGGGTGSSSGNLFQSSSGGSIFGGTSPSSGTTTGGAFSSGMGQSISQSGFGSPTGFQNKPGAFGGSPVFDRGSSGFGASPTFGGAPTFGGSPTFGSPGKVFGSSSPTANVSFGNTGQQQSSTFESLATQNTMTFGNLAQNQTPAFGSPTQSVFGGTPQTPPPAAPAFSGGSAFGGSSFSSWR